LVREKKIRTDIQVLRGVAVIAILLFHANEEIFKLGYLGVDVFFVVSGLVVTPLIIRIYLGTRSVRVRLSRLRDFYIRRFFRLAPALSVMLIFVIPLIFLVGNPEVHGVLASQGFFTLFLIGNLGAYKNSGDYFMSSSNPLIHTWSLSVEEQIYIILPVILGLFLVNQLKILKTTTQVLFFLFCISFMFFLFPSILEPLYSRFGIQSVSEFSFYSPIDRFWQFATGSFIHLSRNKKKLELPKAFKFFQIGLISILILLFTPIEISSKASSIFATFLTALIIIFGSLNFLPVTLVKTLEHIGNASYSIYLYHMPLIHIARYSKATEIEGQNGRFIQTIIAVFISIIFGSLSFHYVENKFRFIGRTSPITKKTIISTFFLFILFPFFLLSGVDIAQKNSYFGMSKNFFKPTYPLALDPDCLMKSESGEPCVYFNSTDGEKILLLGDSHAGHFSQALITAVRGSGQNLTIFVSDSCLLDIQNFNVTLGDKCVKLNERILAWIVNNKPDLIIISEFIASEARKLNSQRTLLMLQELSQKVLIVGNNPVFPDKNDFMVARPIILSPYDPNSSPKFFPKFKMNLHVKILSDELSVWARLNGFETLNLWPLFCNDKYCTRYNETGWLYFDSDHLSNNGAALVIPSFEYHLRRLK